MRTAIQLVERGAVPDALTRLGIRRLLNQRLREEYGRCGGDPAAARRAFAKLMRSAPVTLVPEKANEQHYEVPAAFYELVLGPHLKYSGGLWNSPGATLADAERDMLELSAGRARLFDGQRILELGCGWGSLTLWMAERFPSSRILGISNSASQRESILARARGRGLTNVEIRTLDVAGLELEPQSFDRVVSVEMFEHVRNWEVLLRRVRRWLAPDGLVFLHVFAHHELAYPFESRDESDWMGEHFFSGGMMPAHGLLAELDIPFDVAESHVVDGTHYARTAEAWLANLDARRKEALAVLRAQHGPQAELWLRRWRLFFLACAELFAFRQGREWWVSHHVLRPRTERP